MAGEADGVTGFRPRIKPPSLIDGRGRLSPVGGSAPVGADAEKRDEPRELRAPPRRIAAVKERQPEPAQEAAGRIEPRQAPRVAPRAKAPSGGSGRVARVLESPAFAVVGLVVVAGLVAGALAINGRSQQVRADAGARVVAEPEAISPGIVSTHMRVRPLDPGFVVSTNGGAQSAMVRIARESDGVVVLEAFVSPSEPVAVKLPEGRYRVRWTSGHVWYGEAGFGSDAAFGEHSEPLSAHCDDPLEEPENVRVPDLGEGASEEERRQAARAARVAAGHPACEVRDIAVGALGAPFQAIEAQAF